MNGRHRRLEDICHEALAAAGIQERFRLVSADDGGDALVEAVDQFPLDVVVTGMFSEIAGVDLDVAFVAKCLADTHGVTSPLFRFPLEIHQRTPAYRMGIAAKRAKR